MKYILSTLLFFTLNSFGQSVEPVIGKIDHNDASRTCIVVKLDPVADEVEDEWEDFMKDKHSAKLGGAGFLGTGNLLVAEQIVIPSISPNRMDFYTNIETKNEMTEMRVFAAFGTDIYIEPTKYPAEYKAMKGILTAFLKEYLPRYYQSQVTSIQKNLNGINKQADKLDKKLEKNGAKIEDLKKEMDENLAAQEKNKEKQVAAEKLLEKRKKAFEAILKEIGKL